MPPQMRKILNYTRILHHSENRVECPREIAKAIDRVTFNVHPPLPNEDLTEKLKQLGEEFKSQICEIVMVHLNDRAKYLMEENEPFSNKDVKE